MSVALLVLALLGHALLWIALLNRMHGTGLPRSACRALTLLVLVCAAAIPMAFGLWFYSLGLSIFSADDWLQLSWPAIVYFGTCWIAAAVGVAEWVWRYLLHRPPSVLRYHRSRLLDLLRPAPTATAEDHEHHFLVHLPGNEALLLDVAERALEVPRLSPALEGLTIVHLSDLHFTGRVGKAYFQEVVRLSNRFAPDLVAITGDLVDNPECIEWIPDTLGRLSSRYGTYFILGNHDLCVETRRLRRELTECGLVDLGGRWIEVRINAQPVILAGNELPWIAPAADMAGASSRCPHGEPLRIALCHTPDQLSWAQANDVDLLLAGHTHGGQIRFPLIGPIFSPSRRGVKYASGTFFAPPTIMHVTRGVSGEFPIRMNCPPEMVRLVLHAAGRHHAAAEPEATDPEA